MLENERIKSIEADNSTYACSYTMLQYGKACGGTRRVWEKGVWWYKQEVWEKACGGTRQVWEKGMWWYKTGVGERRVVVQAGGVGER